MHAICQTSAPLDFACVPQLQQGQTEFQSAPALQSSFQEQAPTQYASWQTSVFQSPTQDARCLFQAGLNPTMPAEQFDNFQSQSALQFHHTVCY